MRAHARGTKLSLHVRVQLVKKRTQGNKSEDRMALCVESHDFPAMSVVYAFLKTSILIFTCIVYIHSVGKSKVFFSLKSRLACVIRVEPAYCLMSIKSLYCVTISYLKGQWSF